MATRRSALLAIVAALPFSLVSLAAAATAYAYYGPTNSRSDHAVVPPPRIARDAAYDGTFGSEGESGSSRWGDGPVSLTACVVEFSGLVNDPVRINEIDGSLPVWEHGPVMSMRLLATTLLLT